MPRKQNRTIQQIAAEAVESWYLGVLQGRDALWDGSCAAAGASQAIDSAFDEIERILEDEHVKAHGPIGADQDLVPVMFGRDAGYLIGVQVGLRLRSAGGAQ